MGLHISAIILTEWLLLAGWFSENNNYNIGAFAIVVMWGLGWLNDKPRWPRSMTFRILIYLGFSLLTILIFFLTKAKLAFLTASLIIIFLIADFARDRSQEQ
ncbi:MAG: hypothetical protein MAG431_00910 [Chloroflexi bacterium]|nr:hypothetical protein [Chloroflexota bacterium]